MDDILEGLNQEQLEAVTHKDGPLLIIAGAGTGKTTVIARRISWLLLNGLAKPDELLVLTFTDKAAKEMQERVDVLMPYGYTDIWISTFHSFGDRLLRENALATGFTPDFKVLARPEAIVFFREHLFEFNLSYYRPLSDPTRFIDALIGLFSRARDEDILPEEYLKFALDFQINAKDEAEKEEAFQHLEIANAFVKYQQLLMGQGVLDFASQFYLALSLLRKHPSVLKKYQAQFKYILVDEFQDTNFAQYQLVKLLAQKQRNITVTGDDDQCIYRFRGAAYSNLLNFINDFSDTKKVSIIRNYRSGQAILDSAYRLIQHNNPERFEVKANINKRLIGIKGAGSPPEHLHLDTGFYEADSVGEIIKQKTASGDYKYRDFAILVRSNSDAEEFLQALNMQEIPWQFSGNQGLYTREEVRLCINFLRVAANPYDSLSLYYLASCEVYNFELSELGLCSHYAKRKSQPLYLVFKNINNTPELGSLSADFKDKIGHLLKDLEKFLVISRNETSGRLLYSFLTDTGYLKILTHNSSLDKEIKIQNIAKFFNLVRDFERVAKEDRVINFVNYLNLLIEAGDDPPTVEADLDSDAVNVLTIHKAKGLEFRVVFMVGLVQGRFPWPRRSQPLELPEVLIKDMLSAGDFHLQEERRLFYVGMTRAKEELYLTSAADYGGKRLRRISQFVLEALGQEITEKEKKKASALEAIQRFAPQKEPSKAQTNNIAEAKLLNLSYYHIDDYRTCPLKYKYVHILRVPIMEHHTVIYGKAMHDAVLRYYQHKLKNLPISDRDLISAFDESFKAEGFLSGEHMEERKAVAYQALKNFFNSEEEKNKPPLYVEKDFSFFTADIKINGRWDRIDMAGDKAVIIDFKTSQAKKQKDADKKTKESLQLSIYALAYQRIYNQLPQAVELHFLESGLIGRYAPDEEGISQTEDIIKETAYGIRRQDFSARPQYLSCAYCAYNQICPDAMIRKSKA